MRSAMWNKAFGLRTTLASELFSGVSPTTLDTAEGSQRNLLILDLDMLQL